MQAAQATGQAPGQGGFTPFTGPAQIAASALMSAWQQGGGDLGSLIGVPRVVVSSYNGIPASPAYHQALAVAQDTAGPIAKDTDGPKGRGKFSKVEQWLGLKEVVRKAGLLISQVGGVSVDRAAGVHLRTQFRVVCLADGTGEIYTLDWPTAAPSMTPGDGTATAYTRPWKSFLRGLLMIPQVDDDEMDHGYDQARERIAAQEDRKKNVEAAARAAAARGNHAPAAEAPSPPAQRQAPAPAPTRQAPAPQQRPAPVPQQQRQAPVPAPQQQRQAPQAQRPPTPRPPAPRGQVTPLPQRQAAPPPRQQQPQPQPYEQTRELPPVEEEPIVQYAREQLGGEEVDPNEGPPPPTNGPADGGPDPSLEELLALGWPEAFSEQVNTVASDDPIDRGLKEEFFNLVNEFFGGDNAQAMAAWQGTGFTPQGPKGPQPTGAQIRRYCVKLDWTTKHAAAPAGSQ